MRPYLEHCDELRTPFWRDTDTLERVERRIEEATLVCGGGCENGFEPGEDITI